MGINNVSNSSSQTATQVYAKGCVLWLSQHIHLPRVSRAASGHSRQLPLLCCCRFVAKYLMLASHAVLAGTLVLIWLLIPAQFDIEQPLALQVR